MKNIYRHTETVFERLTSVATSILGSSVTFIIALGMVIYFLGNKDFLNQDSQHMVRDIIHAITFLSLFVIQKEFNRFSAALHVKINELVASHKPANNAVINIEQKTEHEIIQLSKEYSELAEKALEKSDK